MVEFCWRLDAAWAGGVYCGWQRQPNALSVQAVFEGVAQRIFNHPIVFSAAGRTDAGVHVAHQVLGMKTQKTMPLRALKRAFNGLLPNDITVLAINEMPMDFNPRAWGYRKWYRYRWLFREAPCPFRRDYVWHLSTELNCEAMSEAAGHFEGTHEFSAFRASGCSAKSTNRTIESSRFHPVSEDEWVLDVMGNGFLRHQVRIMAGTLLSVGQGRIHPSELPRIIQSGRREAAGQTAPAHGLTLMRSDVRTT